MTQAKQLTHLAVVMDGNGRWARSIGKPRIYGHERGADVAIDLVKLCVERNISELTLFALSSENMTRDPAEVSFIIQLFTKTLLDRKQELSDNGVCVRVIGERKALGRAAYEAIEEVEAYTAVNETMQLNIAFNYSGRWQIKKAMEHALQQNSSKDSTFIYRDFEAYLRSVIRTDPDLLIRTGGEMRLSNFMLWHLAYTELFFTEVMWPVFDQAVLEQALEAFASRQRRYGQVPVD